MPTQKLYPVALSSNELDIDHDLGIVRGVVVIQAGMTKPSAGGHGSFLIDAVTLGQVANAINAKPAGVKVRASHAEIEGVDEILVRIGRIHNARIVGESVVADFEAYDPNNGYTRTILGIAATDPGSAGLSIVSTEATFESIGANQVLRVPSVDAIDFTGEPAAAHSGMLAASTQTIGTAPMTTAAPVLNRQDAQDALLIKMGCPLAAINATGKVALDAFHRPQLRTPSKTSLALSGESLAGVADAYLRQTGPASLKRDLATMARPALVNLSMNRLALSRYFPRIQPATKLSAEAIALASTGDYPALLADTLNKATLTHYASARRSWRAWAKPGTVDDFKQAERPRLDDLPGLVEVEPGSTIQYASPTENASEIFALATYSRGMKVSRRAMLNDDTGALADISSALGLAAARLEDVLAYGVLTANAATADGNTLFSTAHGNTVSGALSSTTLDEAAAVLSKLTNSNGDILDVQAGVLVVPTELRGTAEDILDSRSSVARHESESRLRLVSSGHLSANSASEWYLTTDPSRMAAVELAFLRNNESPHIDSSVDFDSDSMHFKIRHDVRAAAIDPRLMIRSTGS